MALVTDYDCWHLSEAAVTVEAVIGYLKKNAETARAVITGAIAAMPATRGCQCGEALKNSIITDRSAIPATVRAKLDLLVGRYLS